MTTGPGTLTDEIYKASLPPQVQDALKLPIEKKDQTLLSLAAQGFSHQSLNRRRRLSGLGNKMRASSRRSSLMIWAVSVGAALFCQIFVGALLLSENGCAKRVPLTPGQNFQLTVDQTLDVMAHANQLVEQAVTGLPAGIIPINTQRSIVQYTDQTAKTIAAAHTAVGSEQTPQQRAAAVLAALGTISQLPPDIQQFVNSPQSATAAVNLVNLVQNVISLAKALLANASTTASN